MTAPAEMPGVEEIARALIAHFVDSTGFTTVEEDETKTRVSAYYGGVWVELRVYPMARAILGLFAPILAEKERWNRLRAEDIMALGQQLGEAWAALEPFNDALGEDDNGYPDDTKLTLSWRAHTDYSLTLGDLRRARAAAIRAR